MKHHNHGSHLEHMQDFKKRFVISFFLTIPILFLSPMIWDWFGFSFDFYYRKVVIFILSSIIYFYGGWPFLKGFLKEIKKRNPGMMTLITMAISVAYFYSTYSLFEDSAKEFFWELATLIDIMLIGHYIEAKSIMRASNALEGIIKLIPKKAHKLQDNSVIEIEVEHLKPNNIIIVKPGEKIPSDGIVIDGKSLVDESFLSGESKPIQKDIGKKVFMGSTNLDGVLKIEVLKDGKNSYLYQVINLVKEAQESRSKTQDLANRASKWLFFSAFGASLLTFLYWINYVEVSKAILMSVTVLIIACPHALGLAVPLVIAISTAKAAENGILIKNREAFENLKDVKVICFDKTGTLTEGKLFVEKVVGGDEVLKIVASIERFSEHSIAKAIVKKAKNIKLFDVKNFKIFPGIGAKGEIGKAEIIIGNEKILKDIDLPQNFKKYKNSINTKVWVIVEKKVIGVILLGDKIRKNSKDAIDKIRSFGIKTIMLTGDNEELAKIVAKELNIDKFYAKLLPDEKVKIVKNLKREQKVAMVGDGINDAPALLSADIGIAIGAGTDIAAQSADIILTKNSIFDVYKAIILSKATYQKMVQNLWWASGYNIVAIPLAGGVLYNLGIVIEPAIGAIFMSLSTIIVAINAQFLKRIKIN